MVEPSENVTELLLEWSRGDASASERLMVAVYAELRRLARLYLSRERADHTLQPTALVHEAYMRLVDQERVEWHNREQFFGLAAQAMRRVLVDHARRQRADKRGGGAFKLSLDDVHALPGRQDVDLVDLDRALSELEALDPHQSRLVELRYFAGLSIPATADLLGISQATVKREWALARAWLFRRLGG